MKQEILKHTANSQRQVFLNTSILHFIIAFKYYYPNFIYLVRINDTVTFVEDGFDEDIEFGDDISDEGEGDPVDNVRCFFFTLNSHK